MDPIRNTHGIMIVFTAYRYMRTLCICLAGIVAVRGMVAHEQHRREPESRIVSMPLLTHAMVQQRRLAEGHAPLERVERPSHSRHHYATLAASVDETKDPHRSLSEAAQVAGLFQGIGTHYADLWCGTPPQRQTVIVDTGSGVTAFPCRECTHCGVPEFHIDALFDHTQSDTFHKLTCGECHRGQCGNSNECVMGVSYREGSAWTAYESVDRCYIGGFHNHPVPRQDEGTPADDLDPFHAPSFAFDMRFGCQTSLDGLFVTQLADGIMGMDVDPSSFWWQMFDAGQIDTKSFSLCFSHSDDAARDGTAAGAMSLGGVDARLHDTPMVYSSTTSSSGFYAVYIRKVYLRPGGGGRSSALSTDPTVPPIPLDISEHTLNAVRVIVDSGSTISYLPYAIQNTFSKAYQELTGNVYDDSVKHFTPDQLALQPTVLFQFRGSVEVNQDLLDRSNSTVAGLAGGLDSDHPFDVILAIPPEHYYEYDPDEGGYVATFSAEDDGVFGANALMGHDVYFDVENNRIGWAESTCNYTKLVADYTDNYIPTQNEAKDSRIERKKGDNDGEPTDPSHAPARHGVCTGVACQVPVWAGLVLAILYVAQRMARRAPSGPAYDLAQSELELPSTPSMDTSNDESVTRVEGTFA